MSSAISGGAEVLAPKQGHLLDAGIQICINDVTVDANGDDYGGEEAEAMEMDLVKKQWRRSSWCPVEGRKKEERNEKQKMILSVAGKSQSLSSLEGDDDDDSDEASDSTEIGLGNKSQVAVVRHSKKSPITPGSNRPTETQHLPDEKTTIPANREGTDEGKHGDATTQKVGRVGRQKLKKNASSFGLSNKDNPANAKRRERSGSCQAAVKGSCDSEDKDQCHRLSQEATDPGRKVCNMCLLESARFSPSSDLTEVSQARNGSLPPMVTDHACPPFLSSPLATCSEDASVQVLTLNDQPIQNRILLKQTLLEIHRFISRQKSPTTEPLDEDENICSECGCDRFSSRLKTTETMKLDSPAKQTVSTVEEEIEEPSSRDGKQPKIKQHGSVFSKLGSYRQKKIQASNVSVGETLQEKSGSISEGLSHPKTPPQAIKDKKSSQMTSDWNLNSSPPRAITTGSVKTTTVNAGHFQWRRVATKLGIDRAISEDQQKECDLARESGEESHSCHSLVVDLQSMIDIHSSSIESLDDDILNDINDESDLFLMDNEPEAWSVTVDKKTLKKMTAKNIKRQDHIWEFVQTEKSHCRTLKIMRRVFADGMLRELNLSKDMVDRIFPRLDDLLDIHLTFLNRLLAAQRKSVDRSIHDVGHTLQQQFESQMAEKLKTAYGDFCSLQTEAVQLYKDLLKSDVAFQAFIKKCSRNNLCKRLGIPECILLVTQRITKYSLLIEPIIKTTPENSPERRSLVHCVTIIREIIGHVEHQIEARSKELRLFEVYNKLDARSTATLNGKKFKKSDLLSNKRKLIHDGPIKWMSARGKPFEVLVVILSDVIFFLAENNQKCNFFSQDNKSSVISLAKLIVREKGDTKDSKGMYLICQSKTEPEMYEFICKSAEDRRRWIQTIREAINNCSEDGEPSACEEERKLQEATDARLRQLIDQLHHKDLAVAVQCREKMGIALEILEIFAKDDISNYLKMERDHEAWKIFMPESIVQSIFLEATRLFALMQPVTRCNSIMQNCSVGDLERRDLETIAYGSNFSCTSPKHLEKSPAEEIPTSSGTESRTHLSSTDPERNDALMLCVPEESPSQFDLSMTREQCVSLAKILQRVHQLVCLSSCRTTELESMFGQLADANGKIRRLQAENERLSRERKLPSYHPDKQLEELRTLQSSIQQQKMDLEHGRLEHTTAVNQQRDELLQMQRAIDQEREKIQRQKDDLTRQRATLRQQLHLFEDQRIGSLKGHADLGQTGSVENLSERRHSRAPYEEGKASHFTLQQTMMTGLLHQRCMSYDLLKCSDPSPLDSGDERTPRSTDRPILTGKTPGASKSITRMHSMSAVPSGCLSPPAGISRRRSVLLPVQLQRTATAEPKAAAKSMSRSSSKDSDCSPSRKTSRIFSVASPSSLSGKLLAAFSSRMPLAAELLRLSKDRSTSLTSVASASQSMPSSPQSLLRRHADALDCRSPSKCEHAVGHSLSSSPPLTSERHVLRKRLISTLSTGNFLPLKLAECRRPKSASASPQHSSVIALRHSKHSKRALSESQESIPCAKTASSSGKETDVFYI